MKNKQIDYSYQKKAAKAVLNNALKQKYIASVLAACPGAGKTTISHHIINKYLKMYPNAKILVLTEGQNTLKNQYLNDLGHANTDINFTYGDLDSDAQVKVGIPQSISKLDWDKVDLLVVDEAHHFYLADTVQSVIKKLKPNHQVLMTGTPTAYNLHNQQSNRKYAIHYIAAEELQRKEVFSAVDLDVLRVKDKNDIDATLDSIFQKSKQNKDNTDKIMIACPNIKYAKQVAKKLKQRGRKVSISTSENDLNSVEISNFKAGVTDTLVVVGRGILGFNDPSITMMLDFRCSKDVDASYQLFARILRKHPDDIHKSYYRVSDKDYNDQVLMLYKISALMDKETFMKFNGKNLDFDYVA